MRRNGTITVKGVWKYPFNVLVTNCGEYVVTNYKIWYHNPESFFVIKSNETGEWFIQSCVNCM